tara:strand:+ start:806 stop:1309 length:504 start_codon:yes stop_codon:yes gene_type:complete
MSIKFHKHKINLYNILLTLSRNIFFYKKVGLPDTFETRIYLMFIHFSILMIVTKKKGSKFDQDIYDLLFHNIEYNLRELGFGDVSVNKKMKELNKILYDILLKIDLNKNDNKGFKLNKDLLKKYFTSISTLESSKLAKFNDYFSNFFNFCFELHLDNMLEETIKFKF